VLLAEDHPLVLEAIIHRLTEDPGIEVVACVADGHQLVAEYDKLADNGDEPDVVLSDHLLPGCNGIEATRILLERHPQARVIILSGLAEASVVAAAMSAGAVGYLVKSLKGEELHEKIRAAAAGEVVFDGESAKLMIGAVRQTSRPLGQSLGAALSQREREVLMLVSEGLSNADIAARLFVSPQTIKTHLERIFAKLGVSGRAAAVKRGIETGAIPAH
jgi:DNA-binding NarL/FixJ family response regulator